MTPTPLPADKNIAMTPAAVHQSAVFAALFEDMMASQSRDASKHAQLSQTASSHSSVVSVCDSAASFSFKTAMQNQTAPEPDYLSSTLQPHIVAQQPVGAGSPNTDKADLSGTLKDWQNTTGLQSEYTAVEHMLQPATVGKAVFASRARRSFHRQASQAFQSSQQAGLAAAPTPNVRAGTALDGTDCPRVSPANRCGPAEASPSKRTRGKSEAAQHTGAYSNRWSTPNCTFSVMPRCCFGWLGICCIPLSVVVCNQLIANQMLIAVWP